MTCSPPPKDTTIVSGSILRPGVSPRNGQSAMPLRPVSPKSLGGHYRGSVLGLVFSAGILMLVIDATLIFSAFMCVAYTLAAASSAYAQSTPGTATSLDSKIQVRDDFARPTSPAYPLKASPNKRHLVDQNDVPFLMVGDSPQTLIANLSQADAATYINNRRRYGINTLWINILCNYSDGCNKDATTFDGIKPFIIDGDISTPNPAYFQRADNVIDMAALSGMTVLLDPIETSSWLDTLRMNGIAKAFAYGQFIGNCYKNFPNIIWMHGNDFQSWQTATDDALVQAVARGIRSTDPNHIHTVELNYLTSGSLDDPSWAPLIDLDAAYTYFPTYAQVLTEYNRPAFMPVFMVEANYEFEHISNTDGGSTKNLRQQEYWTMLSGATGQLYGSFHTWRLAKGWETNLDTSGVIELGYMKNLFASKKWYDLTPDQTHSVVIGGYDPISGLIGSVMASFGNSSGLVGRVLMHLRKLSSFSSIPTNTYVTAARSADGSLVIAYMPSIRTITVDMSKLAGPVTARWYDPTNGMYINASGSPFANSGEREFVPPAQNDAGDGDWILVLETPVVP